MENPLHDDFEAMRYDLAWLDRAQRGPFRVQRMFFRYFVAWPMWVGVRTFSIVVGVALLAWPFSRPEATFEGNAQVVKKAIASPNGQIVASVEGDDTIRLWDVSTGKMQATLRRQFDPPSRFHNLMLFSPDSKKLAAANRGTDIVLWDVATGQELASLRGHKDSVSSMAFSPDGRILVSGSLDKTIRMWNVAAGVEQAAPRGLERWAASLAFSPDGKTLASGHHGGQITLWDVPTWTKRAAIDQSAYSVNRLAFSPDGKTLAWIDRQPRLWNLSTASERPCEDLRACGSTYCESAAAKAIANVDDEWFTCLAFNPDGKTLAAGHWNAVGIWDVASGQKIGLYRGNRHLFLNRYNSDWPPESFTSASYTPDGKLLALGMWNKTVNVWSVSIFWIELNDVLEVLLVPLIVLGVVIRDVSRARRRQSGRSSVTDFP